MGVVKGVSFATLSLTAFMYLLAATVVSRFVLASALILNIVSLISARCQAAHHDSAPGT